VSRAPPLYCTHKSLNAHRKDAEMIAGHDLHAALELETREEPRFRSISESLGVHIFPLSYRKAITKVLKGAASDDGRVVFVLSGRLLLFDVSFCLFIIVSLRCGHFNVLRRLEYGSPTVISSVVAGSTELCWIFRTCGWLAFSVSGVSASLPASAFTGSGSRVPCPPPPSRGSAVVV
jgi:hypothetical protein